MFRQQTQTSQQKCGKCTLFKQNLLQLEFSSRNKLKRELENVHPLIKSLLSTNKVPNVPIAGRQKHLSKAWKTLTMNQSILDLADGYVIPFQRKSFQSRTPFQLATSQEQQKLMDKEVSIMLKKGAIRQASTVRGEFLSNFFLVKKKNGVQRPVINLKHLKAFYSI